MARIKLFGVEDGGKLLLTDRDDGSMLVEVVYRDERGRLESRSAVTIANWKDRVVLRALRPVTASQDSE